MSVAVARRTAGALTLAVLLAGAACGGAADRAGARDRAGVAEGATGRLTLDLGPDSVSAAAGTQILIPATVTDGRGRVVDSHARPVTFVVRDTAVGRVGLEPRYGLLYLLSTRRGRTWVVGTLVRDGVTLVDSVWVDASAAPVGGR